MRPFLFLGCCLLAACSSQQPLRVSPLVLASCPPLLEAKQQDTEYGRQLRMQYLENSYLQCREAALLEVR